MRDEIRLRREEDIAKAAYGLLEEKGFTGMSMLAIARRAKASNETLYRWYGDKHGLFLALILKNGEDVREFLVADLDENASARKTLNSLGPKLLGLLVSERAIALNRAAAADPTGVLGEALAKGGRGTIAPLIGRVFERLKREGMVAFDDTRDITGTYINMLVGDLQIRRVIGTLGELTQDEILARAIRAQDAVFRLYGV
ncbi:MAG: TetR/AcrR family transcriptional regulator [Cohaesibacteraceae bacterium]|nr:TetR/AcrR family transcriptional regulator [Cohaesibacteraceae bacterium]